MHPVRSTPTRVPTLHVETVGEELCIYNWATQRVHALNPVAARVWRLCDGTHTMDEILAALRGEYGDRADGVLSLAVREFVGAGLLEGDPSAVNRISRRAWIRRVGLTAAMVPVVSSIVAPSKALAQSGTPGTFNYTGAAQTFVVPAGVTLITVDAYGGAGGQPVAGSSGGLGGRVTATLTVTPGESLGIYVGGVGATNWPDCGAGGFNGGGIGNSATGGAGGGASDVRRGSAKLVIAGGGGGGGRAQSGNPAGGAGGGLTGGSGLAEPGGAGGGGGGTQAAGGAGGSGAAGGNAGTSGTSGTGGYGGGGTGALCATGISFEGGAGGGGGYFGGGAGGGNLSGSLAAAGGGGGSSYTDPAATSVTHTSGVRSGNGQVVITW